MHCEHLTNARAIKAIAKNTDLTQGQIKAIQAEVLKDDLGDLARLLAEMTLRKSFNGGKNLIYNYNSQFWTYNGVYWQTVSKEYIGKFVIQNLDALRKKMTVKQSENELVTNAVNLIARLKATADDPLDLKCKPKPIINCLNGELWLNSKGEYKFKKHKAESHLINVSNVKFNPKATCPKYDAALRETFKKLPDCDDVMRHFYEIIGYILHPEKRPAQFFLFRGHGSDGKTTQMKIISALLGDAVLPESIERFATGNFADSHATSSLVGKLLVYDDDLDKNFTLPDGTMKKLAEDGLITANPKGAQPFTFTKICTVVMCCNGVPKTKDMSRGIRRRAQVVPFTRGFGYDDEDNENTVNLNIADEIIETELPGILNKALEGLKRLKQRGYFKEPQSCLDAKNAWLDCANPVAGFIRDRVDITKHYTTDKIPFNDLYSKFVDYCAEQNILRVPTKIQFKETLNELQFKISTDCNYRCKVLGVAFKDIPTPADFDDLAEESDTI